MQTVSECLGRLLKEPEKVKSVCLSVVCASSTTCSENVNQCYIYVTVLQELQDTKIQLCITSSYGASND